MNKVRFGMAGVIIALLGVACQQAAPVETEPQPFGMFEPGRTAPRDLAEEERVWQAVAERSGRELEPILRPQDVPPALDSIQVLRAGPDAFAVEYRGDGRRLTIAAGPMNPPVGETQERRVVRGQMATLQVASAARPHEGVWLWWQEPGNVFYMVSAEGLRVEEVEMVGQSLKSVTS